MVFLKELNMIKIIAMVCFFLSSGLSIGAPSENYVEAEIYYYGWDVRTRTRQSASDVRKKYRSKIVLRGSHEIEHLYKLLKSKKLEEQSTPIDYLDIRLVIDLTRENQSCDTYIATAHYLYSTDGFPLLKLTDAIKGKFRLFEE
jgi:hypothetical protein